MMPAWTPSSGKGSTAVEFSGHTTKSGAGSSPAATASASSWVSRTWLAVTSRWTDGTSRPVPGTSPWTAATVVVPDSTTWNGTRTGATVTTAIPATTAYVVRSTVLSRSCTSSQARLVPGEGDEEADAGHPDPRQRLGPGRVRGGVDEPTERHPAEGEAAAPGLDADPPQGRPERPRAVSRAPGQAEAQRHEERRLEGAHRDPRVGADRAHPHHHRIGEGDAEEQARQPGRARAQAADGQHERGDRGGHQPRGPDRLEGRREHESADQGDEAAERHVPDRSRRTSACRVREERRGFGPTRDRLADDHAKLSTAPWFLPHPAPAGRTRQDAGRWASLASRTPRRTSRCRRRHPRAAQADDRTLPRRSGSVNTRLTCTNARNRRSTRGPPAETRIVKIIAVGVSSDDTPGLSSRCGPGRGVRPRCRSRWWPRRAGRGPPRHRARRRSGRRGRRRGRRSPSPGCGCPP